MGAEFSKKFGKVKNNISKNVVLFGAELGLGGSVWVIGGLKMIVRVVGRPWKPSQGPKRPYKKNKNKK